MANRFLVLTERMKTVRYFLAFFFIPLQAQVTVKVSDREHYRQLKSLLDRNFQVRSCNSVVTNIIRNDNRSLGVSETLR